MTTLLKNAVIVNVFTDSLDSADVLIKDNIIAGVGDYSDFEADSTTDLGGRFVCPGFIDGHIHIESTMMTPPHFAETVIPHGTTCVVADPHEIANVCGMEGIRYMLDASEDLPMSAYFMLPSCVPATRYDETGAELSAEDLEPMYQDDRVLGLAEVMNYPAVIAGDPEVLAKITQAQENGKVVDGHAPLLSGRDLDRYLYAGIQSDHECSSYEEATERIKKGEWLMIREGTAARNLEGLIGLFDEPWCRRCLLVTDDKHPADIIKSGHIDHIIRKAVCLGASPLVGIRMATIQAAQCFGLKRVGAVAPGYYADLLILSDLNRVEVNAVYYDGKQVASEGKAFPVRSPEIKEQSLKAVYNSFYLDDLTESDFHIDSTQIKSCSLDAGTPVHCRIIQTIPGQLITKERTDTIDLAKNNGVDTDRDIIKIAVIERHMHTGHKGLGFISGLGLKKGAIASSVSHDSHNIVVIGTTEADMALAANRVIEMGGGYAVAHDGQTLADLPLPIAGLMSDESAEDIAARNEALLAAAETLGANGDNSPLMTMAFISLSVIPDLKLTTKGLVDVNKQEIVPLGVD